MIPEYRADKLTADGNIEGYLYPMVFAEQVLNDTETQMDDVNVEKFFIGNSLDIQHEWNGKYCIHPPEVTEVDKSTLAIWFDKTDVLGNKIFFSLSKDGIGGDIVEYQGEQYISLFDKKQERARFIGMEPENAFDTLSLEAAVKVVGVFRGKE